MTVVQPTTRPASPGAHGPQGGGPSSFLFGRAGAALAPRFTRLRRILYGQRQAQVATFLVIGTAVAALLAPVIAPDNPSAITTSHLTATFSWAHLLGTDSLGRDVLSRVLFGARFSLIVCVLAVVGAVVVGGTIGVISGWAGGTVDWLLMRATDALLAFPGLLLALAIVGILGAGSRNVVIALAVIFTPIFIRLVRGQVLIVKEELFVGAAQTSGVTSWGIVRRHVLPNIASPVIVQMFTTVGLALIAEGALSYLGLSVQPPGTSLGALLQTGFTIIAQTPRLILVPGIVITMLCWSFNAIADALRPARTATSDPVL